MSILTQFFFWGPLLAIGFGIFWNYGGELKSIPDPLWVALGLYWGYCIWQGFSKYLEVNTAEDFFIAGRRRRDDGFLDGWVFMLAAIATCYSGWTFISHPAQVYGDGFPGAYASLYAITIPLSGLFFLKRQWILGKHCGFVTPAQMFSTYFDSKIVGGLVVIVAFLFSICYIAVQFRASGLLLNVLSDGKLSVNAGMWMLSLVVIIYASLGGLRGVAYVDTMQSILLAIGIVILGMFVLWVVGGEESFSKSSLLSWPQEKMGWVLGFIAILAVLGWWLWREYKWFHLGTLGTGVVVVLFVFTTGTIVFGMANGWDSLTDGIRQLVSSDTRLINGHSHYVTIPGWWGLPGGKEETAKTLGSHWTVSMVLTFLIALMGIQTSPAFSMWTFSNKEPRFFAHQALASALVIGFILILFPAIQGFGGHLLGAEAIDALCKEDSTTTSAPSSTTSPKNLIGVLPYDNSKKDERCKEKKEKDKDGKDIKTFNAETLVPSLIRLTSYVSERMSGWLMALLAICALAAIQSTAASYMVTFGSMLSHDVINPPTRVFKPSPESPGLSEKDQIHWARSGLILVTLTALMIATTFATDTMAYLGALAVAFGLQMVPALVGLCWWPFLSRMGISVGLGVGIVVVIVMEGLVKHWTSYGVGQWPWTIHSAVWGLGINFILASIISRFSTEDEKTHRQKFHKILNQYAGLDKYQHKHVVWLLPLLWVVLAIGPGIMIPEYYNNIWPKGGMPFIWVWQIIGWITGVGMIGYLAYKMELSTEPKGEVRYSGGDGSSQTGLKSLSSE